MTSSEDIKFARRLIPLPKELSITGVRTLRPDEITVSCNLPITPALATALAKLKLFANSHIPSDFVIQLSLTGSPDAPPALSERLRTLPNNAQAYAIAPLQKPETGLLLLANTDIGLLYAVLTLTQLIGLPIGTALEMPMVNVVDWPDMPERGQWGGNAMYDLPWTSQWKLNTLDAYAELHLEADGSPVVGMNRQMISQGRELGVKVVPYIPHLEQLVRHAEPKLLTRRDIISTPDPSKTLPSDYMPGLCMSSKATEALVTRWLEEIADIEDITEIMVWLSEGASPCFCPKCAGREPFEMEVLLLLRAFETIRSRKPSTRFHVMTSQGSFPVNDKILAIIPPDVGVTYYDGGRTYDSSSRPMIYPLLEDYARSGRRLGVYPQITHTWRAVWPWKAPQFICFRAQEFFTKGLSCVIGYAVPSNRFHEFNVMALAEWTWNAKGRTPEEFAFAYATVKGFHDPDIFARWVTLTGNAGWLLAESCLFLRLIYEPELGLNKNAVPYDHRFECSDMCVPERLQEEIAAAKEALVLARRADIPDMIDESECLLTGLIALDAIQSLRQAIQGQIFPHDALLSYLKTLDSCATGIQVHLMQWGRRISSSAGGKIPSRLRDTANVLCRTCDVVWEWAEERGMTDPNPEHRLQILGAWTGSDFAASPTATFRYDVTSIIPVSGGDFDIGFSFDGGAYGAHVEELRLYSGDAVTKSEDFLQSVSRFARWIELRIGAPPTASGVNRFLEVQLSGVPVDAPPDRRTSEGRIGIRKSWTSVDV